MPRHVTTSLKAADRIPGLRPKVEKVRGAPPPWVDWIHKFGPLLTAVVTASIFVGTLRYTVEPVYRRAILEEANARLEIESQKARQRLAQVDELIVKSSAELAIRTAEIRLLSSKIEEQRKKAVDANDRAAIASKDLSDAQISLTSTRGDLRDSTELLSQTKASLLQTEDRLIDAVAEATAGWYRSSVPPCVVRYLNANISQAAKVEDYLFVGCTAATLDANETLLRRLPDRVQQRFRQLAKGIDSDSETRLSELAKLAAVAAQNHERLLALHKRERDELPRGATVQDSVNALGTLTAKQRRDEDEIRTEKNRLLESIRQVITDDHAKFVNQIKAK